MINAQVVESRATLDDQSRDGGAIPTSALHFRTGRRREAEALVMAHHYSRKIPSAIEMVGSLHLDGGLFGGDGPMMAAAFFSHPAARWREPVIELSRLVRGNQSVPLTLLLSRCMKALKQRGFDLIVSYADRAQGHEGTIYRAANWQYSGVRLRSNDGLIIDGVAMPGRTCNHVYGTQSLSKLCAMFPGRSIEVRVDQGKHMFWYALGSRGTAKARRLEMAS